MLKQNIYIDKYDWIVDVYYHVDCYYVDEILDILTNLGCDEKHLDDAYNNLKDCKLNTGLTYSNIDKHKSIVVISNTSTPCQFLNSLVHEIHHLTNHIGECYGLLPRREASAYLAGYLAECVYPKAKQFLCKCHCK